DVLPTPRAVVLTCCQRIAANIGRAPELNSHPKNHRKVLPRRDGLVSRGGEARHSGRANKWLRNAEDCLRILRELRGEPSVLCSPCEHPENGCLQGFDPILSRPVP